MKYLLALSILVAALLIPAAALGQTVITYCDIWYDEGANTVNAFAYIYSDYEVPLYYNLHIQASIWENSQVLVYSNPAYYPNACVQLSVPAQPAAYYTVYAESRAFAVFSWELWDPLCYINPYWCQYSCSGYYFDPFYYYSWGNFCDGFISTVCTGYGPPMCLDAVEYTVGYVYSQVRTPPSLYLGRSAITTLRAVGTPQGGGFDWQTASIIGLNPPNTILEGPQNTGSSTVQSANLTTVNTNGQVREGGLRELNVGYWLGGYGAVRSYKVAAFGMSCYITALETDSDVNGTCTESVILSGNTYTGTTGINGVTGTFCKAFIAKVSLNGTGIARDGRKIRFVSGAWYTPLSNTYGVFTGPITGGDGTEVIAGRTVARDRGIIPDRDMVVNLDGFPFGVLANDVGSSIVGYRFDLYNGYGNAVCNAYPNPILVGYCTDQSQYSYCPMASGW